MALKLVMLSRQGLYLDGMTNLIYASSEESAVLARAFDERRDNIL